jgi:hypothetical protein
MLSISGAKAEVKNTEKYIFCKFLIQKNRYWEN